MFEKDTKKLQRKSSEGTSQDEECKRGKESSGRL